MARASLAVDQLMKGVLVVISAVILITLALAIFRGGEDIADRYVCRESVKVHSALQLKTYNPSSEIIDCPSVYRQFDAKSYTVSYRDRQRTFGLPDDADKRQASIKRQMAEEIYQCWNQFGEGKLDLFGGPKTYCSVCAVFQFRSDRQIDGFYGYLMKNNVPNSELANNGVTYFDYMMGRNKGGFVDNPAIAAQRESLEASSLDASSPYAVVFVYAKSEPFVRNAEEFLAKFYESGGGKVAIAGGVVLIVGGAIVAFIVPPGGGAMVAAGAAIIFKVVTVATIGAGIEGAAEAYVQGQPVKDWMAFTVFGRYDESLLRRFGCEELSDKII